MTRSFAFILTIALFTVSKISAQEIVSVDHFDKVIVSPHIQVTFIKGDKESVTIQSSSVSRDKINIESKGNTLRVYLDSAKEITRTEKVTKNGYKTNVPIYNGTVLTLTISYTDLKVLSVRGEETIQLKSKLDQDNFDLRIYGECKVYLDQVQLKKFNTTIYGASYLELKSGNVAEQKFTAYGESEINTLAVTNQVTKATLYGESQLKLNVSDQIRVTAFGDSKIGYKGDPEIKKGISIGKADIYKIN